MCKFFVILLTDFRAILYLKTIFYEISGISQQFLNIINSIISKIVFKQYSHKVYGYF